MFMVNGMADKSFVDAGLSIKAEVTYSQNSYLLSQSTELINNTSHIMSAHASSTFQKLSWLRLILDATGTLYWEKNSFYDTETLVSVNTNASVYVFPFKGFEIKMRCQSITNEISPSQYKSLTLFDASLHYKINKMWEFGLTGTNLLNTEHYAVTQNSGLNSYCSSLPLRGREILFRLLLHI